MKYTTLPLSIAKYCCQQKKLGELRVFVYLKLSCSGNPSTAHNAFTEEAITRYTGIKSKKTFRKYLSGLVEMGWVGYNVNKSIYHVRGYQQVVAKIGTSEKAAVTVRMEDLRQFQCFISASIVGRKVKDTERYTILNSRKDRPALHKGDDANQGLDFFGLSNNTIADLLRVSKT